MDRADAHVDRRLLALVGVFVTALVAAQVIASKLVAFGPFVAPAGTLAYALTFWSSDVISELYGEATATATIRVAFGMNIVLLALVWGAILLPGAGGVDPALFEQVLGPATNIVIGSLLAFLVSQHTDVRLFHAIRARTGRRYLWLRNVGSTGIAQLVDTAIFAVVAFVVAPAVLGVGSALPLSVVWSIVVGQYVVKLLLALIDTPLVYATVRTPWRGVAQ